MKKSIFITSILLLSIIFAGCYSPVFYDIRNDVAPESATVSGNLTSITRYTVNGTEFIALAADGGLRYKAIENNTHGTWLTFPNDALPFSPHKYDYFSETHSGEQIIKVLADSTTLYLVTASYVNDTSLGTTVVDKIKLYGAEISSFTLNSKGLEEWTAPAEWTEIIGEADSSTYFPTYIYSYYQFTAFGIFQTNAPQTAHRKVYIRTGNTSAYSSAYTTVTYYKLNGTAAPSEISVTPQEMSANSSSTNNANSAVWFKDDVIFFNSLASVTNETYKNDASYFYYSEGSTVYHSDTAGSKASSSLSAGSTVSALMPCADSLIIGRGNFSSSSTVSGGIRKTSLTDGIPGTELIDFETNASFQISTAYYVTALINTTPDKNEKASNLYAAITYMGTGTSTSVSAKNKGLWSYYPERGNWNRE